MGVYESIIQGLIEAVEYEKGNGKARTAKCTVNPAPEYGIIVCNIVMAADIILWWSVRIIVIRLFFNLINDTLE